MEAINIYVHEHGLTGLAVCSRLEDYSADRIFLRKVGGGYIFIHRLMQEYFAELEPDG